MTAKEREDEGFTLVELLAAMIIAVFLMLAIGSIALTATSLARRTVNISEASVRGRAALDLVGKEMPEASWISTPGKVGSDWYVETLVPPSSASTVASCRQWRVVAADGVLQSRTWSTVNPQPSAWRDLTTWVIADPSQPPFTVVQPDANYMRAQVLLTITVNMPEVGNLTQQASYTLRNSTKGTGPYCTEVSRS